MANFTETPNLLELVEADRNGLSAGSHLADLSICGDEVNDAGPPTGPIDLSLCADEQFKTSLTALSVCADEGPPELSVCADEGPDIGQISR